MNPELYIKRCLNLQNLMDQKSYFLLGPRQTGKTSLIAHSLKNVRVYNLLDNSLFLEMSRDPGRLAQEIGPKDKVVVIDEIQRLPELLNEVHRLIEEKGLRFLLTGSSARKLRRKGVNLLGGRARTKHLHPLTYDELNDKFDLNKALNAGLIPSIYFSDDADADLSAYCGTYLKEEILAESLIRNIPAFSRFLKIVSLCNARIVNFTNVANDAQVPRTTVYEYFEILKDTLIIRELPAFLSGKKRKPICSSKFYFFDIGVARNLQGRSQFAAGTPEYGDAFETFIVNEIFALSDYCKELMLSFWRSKSGYEVDLIIGKDMAIEIKGKSVVSPDDLRGLKALEQEHTFKRRICVCLEKRRRQVDGVEVVPYQDFLAEMWGDGRD